MATKAKMTERRALPPKLTTVTEWFRAGLFENEEEARGAFKLAHQQFLDGAGAGYKEWTGMTEKERAAYYRADEKLPRGGRYS